MRNVSVVKLFLSSILVLSGAMASGYDISTKINTVEESIYRKIDTTLSLILPPKSYLIDIVVTPKIVEEAPPPAEQPKPENKVTFSNSKEDTENFIVFHNLGLAIPKEFATPNNPTVQVKKVEEFEIESVSINVVTDSSIPAPILNNAKKILSRMRFSQLKVKPKINYSKSSFLISQEKPEEKQTEDKKDLANDKPDTKPLENQQDKSIELMSKFSNSVALVICVLIFCIFGLILMKRYTKFQEEQNLAIIESQKDIAKSAQESAPQTVIEDTSSNQNTSSHSVVSNPDGASSSGEDNQLIIDSSLQRFNQYLDKNELDAANLIKRWIKQSNDIAKSALFFVAQRTAPESLIKLFSHLSMNERNIWRASIQNINSDTSSLKIANFIDEQILGEIIVPNDIISEETKSLLYGIDENICLAIMNNHEELVPILMNTLSPNLLLKTIEKLEPEKAQQFTLKSVENNIDNLKLTEPLLFEKLKDYSDDSVGLPVSDKLIEILPHVEFEKEDAIIKAIGKTLSPIKFRKVLASFIPTQAIFSLPESTLKTILNSIAKSLLIDFIVTSDETNKLKYLNMVAAEGSKKREMLDFEIQDIVNDELKFKRIQKRAKQIQSEFVSNARKIISSNILLQDELEPILDQIANESGGGSTNSGAQNVA